MRTPSSFIRLACILPALCLALQASPVRAQIQAAQQHVPLNQAQSKKQQMVQHYAGVAPTQAVLTLTATPQVAQPNQDIHFSLAWNRPVYRVTYHFDWGDNTPGDTTELAMDHSYSTPGQYTVRVTASPIAAKSAIALVPNNPISSNAVTISVEVPEKPTVALSADRLNLRTGDTVTFSAAPHPDAADAQYTFNFGDGNQQPSTSNQTEHTYTAAGTYNATVTALTSDGQQSATSPPVEITVTEVPPVAPQPPPVLKVTLANSGPLRTDTDVVVSAALDPPQRNATFEFDWGDNSPAQNAGRRGVASHRYASQGWHEVVVTAITEQAYDPPLQGMIRLNIGVPPRPVWPIVAVGAGAVFILALILGLAIGRLRRPPAHEETEKEISQQKFTYVPFEGAATHKVKMKTSKMSAPVRSLGPFKLEPGMDHEEHTLTFRG